MQVRGRSTGIESTWTCSPNMTGTHDVTLAGLYTLSDDLVSGKSRAERHGLAQGAVPPAIPDAVAVELDAYARRIRAMELRWVQTLAGFRPSEPPYQLSVPDRPGASADLSAFGRVLRDAPEELRPCLALASLIAVLSRLGGASDVGIGLANDLAGSPLSHWFETVVPFVIEVDPACTMGSLLDVIDERQKLVLSGSYPRDLFARYPALRGGGQPRFGVALHCADVDAGAGTAVADLEVMVPSGGGVLLVHHGALEPWQVESLDRCLAAVAETALRHPETSLAAVPLLSPEDRHRVLVEWNATEREIPDLCVHELIAEAAERFPERAAVRFGDQSLTYSQLLRRSTAVAECLLRAGVQTGDVVALSAPRSVELVAGMLGILQAGAAYMPIDPSYPEARGRVMLEDAAVRIGVTTKALAPKYFSGYEVILLNDHEAAPPTRSVAFASPRPPAADDLVYVIYTSGSTGKPKGVEVRHRGLVNHSLAIARNYALAPGDRLLCSASISFDVAAEQIYPALFSGAEVVMRPDDLFDSFTRFDEFLRAERISVMVLPTAFWHEWVRDMEARGASPAASVRVLSVGTEKALGGHFSIWQQLSGERVRFFQGYGPTETTITCTMFAHDHSEADSSRPLPIGRPLPNTQIYLLDALGEPVPIGAVGEIHVGGLGLARGYRNNAEMTGEWFTANPFRPGERVYRTGDLGRFQSDGQIVFLGRRDSQVKVRGFRVELGEVEQVLREHPGVDEAAVLLRSDYGVPELVAYVVPRGEAVDAEALLDFMRQRVPEYMVPRAVVGLRAFPKTSNEKVDRAALPVPSRRESGTAARVPPRNERERALHSLWAEVLAGQEFGIEDDFFSLGGNSLSALRMLGAAEQKLGARIPLSHFATGPTIARLARSMGGAPVRTSLVVRVQEGDSRPPLWVVHPVGGHVVYAQTLRRHMDPSQPIRGLQARGLDGREEPLDTIESMAELYVGRVLEEQPRGPYLLAGSSMGGLVVYEMAQILRRRGQSVALLALLDTRGPNFPTPTSRWTRLADQFETIRSQPSYRSRLALVWDRFRSLRDVLPFAANGTNAFVPPRYEVLGGVELPPDLRAAILEVTRANERANVRYRPAPYDGRMLLLRAAVAMRWSGMRFDDPYNGWRPLVRGGVDRVVIDCTHSELADDPPAAAGRALQEAVDRALYGSPTSRR
jgi:amino acid adenylation domain-containing protein